MFISRLEIFVHNFMFLFTFSRKLYEHLNMFIRIGHIFWHLLNMFLSIFVTILSFFISTNQNHFKIKKTKPTTQNNHPAPKTTTIQGNPTENHKPTSKSTRNTKPTTQNNHPPPKTTTIHGKPTENHKPTPVGTPIKKPTANPQSVQPKN